MRVVATLVAAVLLLAVVVSASGEQSQQAKAAALGQHARKLFGSAARAFGTRKPHVMMQHEQHLAKVRAAGERMFSAKQNGNCDATAYSSDQLRVLASCPTLVDFFTGAIGPEEFLPGFCDTDCFTALSGFIDTYEDCLDEQTRIVTTLTAGCATTPECFTEEYFVGGAALAAACDLTPLFSLETSTTAAEIDGLCTGNCVEATLAFTQTYGACSAQGGGEATNPDAMRAFTTHMCNQVTPAGATAPQRCSVLLRGLGQADCDTQSSSTCESRWCTWSSSTGCSPAITAANLDTVCTSCLTDMATLPTIPGGPKPVEISLINTAFCSKENSTYCFPMTMSAFDTLTTGMARGSNGRAELPALCGSRQTRTCAQRVLQASADLAVAEAREALNTCLVYTGAASATFCTRTFESSVGEIASSMAIVNLLCKRNGAGNMCFPYYMDALQSSCTWWAERGSCSSSCDATMLNLTQSAGCCVGEINKALSTKPSLPTGQQSVRASSGVIVSYTFSPTAAPMGRMSEPVAFFTYCNSVNTTGFWDNVTMGCGANVTRPTRVLRLRLAWSQVVANPNTKRAIEQSLRSDIANAMGVPVDLVEGTLVEDPSATVTINAPPTAATTAPASRRQTTTTTTSPGCQYDWSVGGDNDADAAANAAAFDAQSSNFQAPATASTVQAECTNCQDTSQTNPLEIASSSGGGGGSSARAVTAAAAVLAALVLALF